MIAAAAPAPWLCSVPRFFASLSMPPCTLSIGINSPMRPVEHTAISDTSTPKASAVSSAIFLASVIPCAPLHALALPALKTAALSSFGLPSLSAAWVTFTGAATTRLRVKTAAASKRGPWLTTSAISGLPDGLMPAVVEAAEKPCGTVTPCGSVSEVVIALILFKK